ncbi:unnamed protein product [Mytilus coruscus]|uniref:Uncharacterized protein n=1 Tax=Mytilus coruscus TaxID=42192 RepID=A0A6J8EFF5_MYTCO|nr:unnamed protein product [Mytilus coruscus]
MDEEHGLTMAALPALMQTPPDVRYTFHSSSDYNPGISIQDFLISSGSVTVIIAVLGLYYCYNKHKRKTVINSTPAIINETPPAENDGFRNETFELNENIYHTIDENNMINLVSHDNPYLYVVDALSCSESIKSTSSSTSGYLHPYHSFVASSNDHPYEPMKPVNEAIDLTKSNITEINIRNASLLFK